MRYLDRILLFVVALGLLSCAQLQGIDPRIVGSWQTVEWKIEKTNELIPLKMEFHFDSSGYYKVDYGNSVEEGTYYIQGERLYTTEKGQAQKYVQIVQLSEDTMRLRMNRAGRLELLTLVKKR